MSKHKKTFTILGLTAAVVILVGAIFVFTQPPEKSDPDIPLDETTGNVAVGDIESAAPVTDSGIKPEPIASPDPSADEPSSNDIPLTVIGDKPEPPDKPDTANTGDKDEPHEPPTDPTLVNPDQKPDSSPKSAVTEPPKDTPPNAGDKKDGQVYIPGFGWVDDEGGGGQGEKSELDPEHSDFDKIIGH